MTTIKSYTDIKQSRRMAEILPIESADMYYALSEDENMNMISFGKPQGFFDKTQVAWSLAALLDVLPPYLYEWEKGIDFNLYPSVAKKRWWCAGYISQDLNPKNKDRFTLITHADNPVDACVAMIEKLNELKML